MIIIDIIQFLFLVSKLKTKIEFNLDTKYILNIHNTKL
jgi:hypothetical protein